MVHSLVIGYGVICVAVFHVWLVIVAFVSFMTVKQVTNALGLQNVTSTYHVQACSARNNHGIVEGMEWLAQQLLKDASMTTKSTVTARPISSTSQALADKSVVATASTA